jgi:predicted RND superfamily exporter protein
MSTSNAASALVDSTRSYIASNFPSDVTGTVAGVALLYTNMEEYIRQSLIRGFTVALIAIFVIMCIQLRSLVLGAIAMIPNLVPIVICVGIMGIAGIRLDTMTSMVASISIGLAVDDSIHFITRVRQHLARGAQMTSSLLAATVEISRALIYTSLTLVAGFAVMLASSFVGTIYFGMLCMITIVFALLADLLLLPVVLRWYSDRRRGARGLAPTAETAGTFSGSSRVTSR